MEFKEEGGCENLKKFSDICGCPLGKMTNIHLRQLFKCLMTSQDRCKEKRLL